MKYRLFKFLIIVQIFLLTLGSLSVTAEAATIHDQFRVSGGVHYKDTRLTSQAVRTLEINLNDPFTKVDVGYPGAFNSLSRTTAQAHAHHQPGNLVVGAVNANFFHIEQSLYYGMPMNLVSKDNQLVHAGKVYGSKANYVNEPIAFGIDSAGKGLIDYYKLDLHFLHNGKKHEITSTNREREAGTTILYTSQFPYSNTRTNEWGTEVAITFDSTPMLEFGSTVTGTISQIRALDKADHTKTPPPLSIPKNGFVLSGSGIGSTNLEGVKIGDEITLSVDVDAKWKNSAFMLASGAMLVKDGKVALSMDPKSTNANQRAPRTAVALDRTGSKVFFVTVDGRQKGYSTGMSLTEFAQHLVNMGVDRALNLDGGGSTTMATRKTGEEKVTLSNSPSDGRERAVSAVLMAISTAPVGQTLTMKVKNDKRVPLQSDNHSRLHHYLRLTNIIIHLN